MDSLEEYHRKRDFAKTREPEGNPAASGGGHTFVIQKHAARRAHYDLRLELDRVLKSWAVPKGPSLDPGTRRLAVRTEDHPIEYAGFEGVIPAGEYGGGTVLLWDRGDWEPIGDAHKGLEKGHLAFALHGEKLRGEWNLVRMGKGDNWLLVKRRDEEAREGGEPTVDLPRSVATGRDLEAIARDRVTESEEAATKPMLVGAKRGKLPASFDPQLATLAEAPPAGEGWLHELKCDGYRILARISHRVQASKSAPPAPSGDEVTLLSRNGKDWTERFAPVAEALRAVLAEALLDGEVAVLDSGGRTDFQALQSAVKGEPARLVYFVFDVVHLNGVDLRGVALEHRKALLKELLGPLQGGVVRYGDHIEGRGELFFGRVCDVGAEGIISKRAGSTYRSGRGRAWLKIKCRRRQEMVIGGYTDPSGGRSGFGALLVGVYEGDALRFLGRVGTGFDDRTLAALAEQLRGLEREHPPFAEAPTDTLGRKQHWVEPVLVAEVEYGERTRDGLLRHPVFLGLREDKEARDVRDEAVESQGASEPREVETVRVRLTHPERVLYPEQGLTKRELAKYYVTVADRMLPHIAGRPLSLERCPRGQGQSCFYQKHADDSTPDEIHRVVVREGDEPYTMVDSVEGLVGLVQMGVLAIHAWGSRVDRIERPDVLVFDLDPDTAVGPAALVDAVRTVRSRLQDLGLETFLKTTGGKGFHLVAPVVRRQDWPEAKAFCQAVAQSLARDDPKRFTATLSKASRVGKVFVDTLRNAREATAVAPFSTRARPGATVATPVRWDELDASLRPDGFTVSTLPRRLSSLRGDPWDGFFDVRQSVTARARREVGLGR